VVSIRLKVFLASAGTAAISVAAFASVLAGLRLGGWSEPYAWLSAIALGTVAAIAAAGLLSGTAAASLARRSLEIQNIAAGYAKGDLRRPDYDYGADELAGAARAMDAAMHQLGRRLDDLSRDRARMEAILGGMVEGVLVVDARGRLQLLNRAAQEMLRVDAEATGRPYLEVVRHPDVAAALTSALQGDKPGSRELMLARDPGRTLVAGVAPVSGAGGGAVLVLHDVTDLRRADEIRRDFVANVSHELRTPLTAIRGYVEALVDDPVDAETSRRFLDIIARHAARMERLVKDLLHLARLDARQEMLEMASCDVRQLFATVTVDLASSIEAKGHEVTIDVPDEARLVQADPAKLHDVLRNLVENAVNYSPERATVQLSAATVGDAHVIEVADSGPGIPPDDLDRVFERFYRVDKSRAAPGGTGLGLAIVKHLVELHGGETAVRNRSEGGTVFTIRLPVVPSQPRS
jgi:two-component system phosphate regulon sensor histidine kinase PhoR